jgi:acetyl esterase
MPLHPQVEEFRKKRIVLNLAPNSEVSPEQARANSRTWRSAIPADLEPVGKISDRTIPGPESELPIRIYRPDSPGPHPLLMLFHGGGWLIGDLDHEDPSARRMCNQVNAVVVSIDYRLAPETRFPGAPEDCYAGLLWAVENIDQLGIDATNIAVTGTSAGGNLAAAVAQMARDRGGPTIKHQTLFCPVIDYDFDRPSYTAHSDSFALTEDSMRFFWKQYLGTNAESNGHNPYASPIRAESLAGLPDATIITPEFDPLIDEAVDYANALKQAGVDVTYTQYEGMAHAFNELIGIFDAARVAVDEASARIRSSFNK